MISVLGRSLSLGLDLIGTGRTVRSDTTLAQELASLKAIAQDKGNLLEWRERRHIDALDRFASGSMLQATQIWEDILLEHPTDMMALKMAHDSYFYLGHKQQIRDSIARVMPWWVGDKAKHSSPLPLSE